MIINPTGVKSIQTVSISYTAGSGNGTLPQAVNPAKCMIILLQSLAAITTISVNTATNVTLVVSSGSGNLSVQVVEFF